MTVTLTMVGMGIAAVLVLLFILLASQISTSSQIGKRMKRVEEDQGLIMDFILKEYRENHAAPVEKTTESEATDIVSPAGKSKGRTRKTGSGKKVVIKKAAPVKKAATGES